MYVDVKNYNIWYRYYFVAFFYIGVLIVLNILIAFAIDIYGSVEELNRHRENSMAKLKRIAQEQKELKAKRVSKFIIKRETNMDPK